MGEGEKGGGITGKYGKAKEKQDEALGQTGASKARGRYEQKKNR